jgi:hypothetical protein
MYGRCFNVFLGRAAPNHYHPFAIIGIAEVLDVVHYQFCQVGFGGGFFYVVTIQVRDVCLVKNSFHGFDAFQFGLHRMQQHRFQDFCLAGCFKHIVAVHIPAAENELTQFSKGNKFFYFRVAVFGAFSQPDISHLRQ